MAVLAVTEVVQLKVVVRRTDRYLKQYASLLLLECDVVEGLSQSKVAVLRRTHVPVQLNFLSLHHGVSVHLDLASRQNGRPPHD